MTDAAVSHPGTLTSASSVEGPAGAHGATALRVVPEADSFDRVRAVKAVAELLQAFGRDVSSPHLSATPRRVVDAFEEMLTPIDFDLTTFPNEEGYDELVLVKDIPFHSLCEHHLLPFYGVAHIAYLPGERILGLSKLARVLEYCSRDLQVQERLTTEVADWLRDKLSPRGVGVVLEAQHMCMSLRGVRVGGSTTVTSALRGAIRDDVRSRTEFFALTGLRA